MRAASKLLLTNKCYKSVHSTPATSASRREHNGLKNTNEIPTRCRFRDAPEVWFLKKDCSKKLFCVLQVWPVLRVRFGGLFFKVVELRAPALTSCLALVSAV